MTADELIEKVKARMTPENSSSTSPLEATFWFIAYRMATEVLEDFSAKDLAYTILGGATLGGPFETVADIEEWINDAQEEDEEEVWGWLDAALDQHFGK